MIHIPVDAGFSLLPVDRQNPHALERILNVYRQCEDFLALGPQAHASREMVLADLANADKAGSTFYGIYLQGQVMAGILDFLPGAYMGDARQAHLALIMIARPYRRNGLGRRILDALEYDLRQRSVHTFVAHVQINNPVSLAFFQTAGFKISSEPELQADGTTSLELRKNILNMWSLR